MDLLNAPTAEEIAPIVRRSQSLLLRIANLHLAEGSQLLLALSSYSEERPFNIDFFKLEDSKSGPRVVIPPTTWEDLITHLANQRNRHDYSTFVSGREIVTPTTGCPALLNLRPGQPNPITKVLDWHLQALTAFAPLLQSRAI